MIATLKGTITHILEKGIIINVSGVGYLVSPTQKLRSQLSVGKNLEICTYLQVREDHWLLFAFASFEELALFELLLSVSGVGPKTALMVVDRGVMQVKNAIAKSDVSFFTGIPRLGTKNAQKIIIDLKPKLALGSADDSILDISSQKELMSALIGMGFSKAEVSATLHAMPKELSELSQQLKWALQQMGKKNI